ncbi:MAG: ATP-binding protein [Omnitrophica bacterium]|nr:ATP-binding protein [Candidatus Omnitrophota bacterium]
MTFRISTKLIIWFLFIALLPLTIGIYISYDSSQKAIEREARERLFTIADNEAGQIKAYFREKEKEITQLSLMPDLRTALIKFKSEYDIGGLDSAGYNAVYTEYAPFLNYYQRTFGYSDILLVSAEGNVVFSAKKKRFTNLFYKRAPNQDLELPLVFTKTTRLSSLKTEVSDFGYDPVDGKVVAYIGVPVLESGNYIGTLITRMDTKGISEIVGDYRGLGETGEVIIAAKMGSNAVYIVPLRFDPDATFNKKVSIGSLKALAVQEAVRGRNGSGMYLDYRGNEVLAIWSYLSSFNLGIVVKMDTDEIFAAADKLRRILSVTGLVLLVVVVILAIVVAQTISGPVTDLTRVSGIITQGNLSERAKIKTGDEIGELAHSFNQMTDSLVEAKSHVEAQKSQLEEQKKMLEKVNKELDSFVYTASHDLRAPLRAISSFSGFLEEDSKNKLNKEGREHLGEIQKGVDRMDALIRDLLLLSRITRIKNPYEDVDIKSLIDSVVERIKFDIKKSNVDLKIQENLPRIRCDRIKMGEVFVNLITNAIKFSSKNNKARPKVEIGYRDEGDSYEFYVRDNGIGIAPQFHKDVFTIFRRLQTAQDYDGTGAGLAIVKRIIDDHEGRIWIESESGKGATFRFTIPKSKQTASHPAGG